MPVDSLPAPDPVPPGKSTIATRPCLYPSYYTWIVLLAALDVMFTWVILYMGGRELNPVADWFIKKYNLLGVVMLKLGTLMMVLCICEIVGLARPVTGRKLVRAVSVILAIPVTVQCILMVIVLVQSPAKRFREMGESIEAQATSEVNWNAGSSRPVRRNRPARPGVIENPQPDTAATDRPANVPQALTGD